MILLFLLGCTAHIESFHRIVPVDLAVFALPFFALKRVQKMGGNCRYGRSWGRGRCFPVKRKCLEQRVNVVFFACRTSLCAHCNCNYARARAHVCYKANSDVCHTAAILDAAHRSVQL